MSSISGGHQGSAPWSYISGEPLKRPVLEGAVGAGVPHLSGFSAAVRKSLCEARVKQSSEVAQSALDGLLEEDLLDEGEEDFDDGVSLDSPRSFSPDEVRSLFDEEGEGERKTKKEASPEAAVAASHPEFSDTDVESDGDDKDDEVDDVQDGAVSEPLSEPLDEVEIKRRHESIVAARRHHHEEALEDHEDVSKARQVALTVLSSRELFECDDEENVGDAASLMAHAFSHIPSHESPQEMILAQPLVIDLLPPAESEDESLFIHTLFPEEPENAPAPLPSAETLQKAAEYKKGASIAKIVKIVGQILFAVGAFAAAMLLGSSSLLVGLGLALILGAVVVSWILGTQLATSALSQSLGKAAEFAAASVAIKTAAVFCGVTSGVGALLWTGGALAEKWYANKLLDLQTQHVGHVL